MGDRVLQLKEQYSVAKRFYDEFARELERYRQGRGSIYAVERLAQLLAQAVLDFAAMLAVGEAGSKPSTYRALAAWLADRLGLNDELRGFLVGLAGFRNILVHGYARLDRGLEERAFDEIKEKMPRILERIGDIASRDPCLNTVLGPLRRVLEEWGDRIEYAVIFGSLARRGCGQDVDIAIKFRVKPRSALELGRLQAELEDAVGTRVDLVDVDEAPPSLLKTIIDEAIPVYGDDKAQRDLARRYTELLDLTEAYRRRAQ